MSEYFDWNGLLMNDDDIAIKRLSRDEARKYELSRFKPGDENGHGIRLYVGEIRTEKFNDVCDYEVFPTFEEAADWCLDNTQCRKLDNVGIARTLDAYDWKCINDRIFYGDKSRCRYSYYFRGFFSIRTITVL
jgi:hypothetical protein